MKQRRKYIHLKQLPTKPKALAELVSLVSSNVSNAKVKRYIRDKYNHKLIYDSSIGLLRSKIKRSFKDNIPLTDLLKGKGNHNAQPLHHVSPMQVINQELARIYRESVTGTINNEDKRELIQLLRCYMKSNDLVDYEE